MTVGKRYNTRMDKLGKEKCRGSWEMNQWQLFEDNLNSLRGAAAAFVGSDHSTWPGAVARLWDDATTPSQASLLNI